MSVTQLLQAVGRTVNDSTAGQILAKQLTFKNTNKYCNKVSRSHRKKASIQDMIKICAEIGPAYVQGITLVAAIQWVFKGNSNKSKGT